MQTSLAPQMAPSVTNGVSQYVIIPETIKGIKVTSYKDMFRDSGVKGVISNNSNITDMSYMFYNSLSTTLDGQPNQHGERDHYGADVYIQQCHLTGPKRVQHDERDHNV